MFVSTVRKCSRRAKCAENEVPGANRRTGTNSLFFLCKMDSDRNWNLGEDYGIIGRGNTTNMDSLVIKRRTTETMAEGLRRGWEWNEWNQKRRRFSRISVCSKESDVKRNGVGEVRGNGGVVVLWEFRSVLRRKIWNWSRIRSASDHSSR